MAIIKDNQNPHESNTLSKCSVQVNERRMVSHKGINDEPEELQCPRQRSMPPNYENSHAD